MRKIIASVDIGSNFIKIVVGEFYKNRLHILAASQTPSLGINGGFVVDPKALISRLEEAFQKCENILGVKVTKVILSVPSDSSAFFISEGVCTITNEDHVVKNADVIHAMQASTYNRIDNDREIVFIRPTSYLVDDEKTPNPIGVEGEKLTVKCLIATVPRKNAYSLIKCLGQIGIEVKDFTVGGIGDYFEFQKEMMIVAEKMALEGNCILTPVYPVLENIERTEDQLIKLKEAHFKRIELSDAILVINVNNYIGNSTNLEIEYAKKSSKEIIYYTDLIKDN